MKKFILIAALVIMTVGGMAVANKILAGTAVYACFNC